MSATDENVDKTAPPEPASVAPTATVRAPALDTGSPHSGTVARVRDRVDRPLASAATVSGTTLVSRVLGMVRDIACAHLFGAGWVWDAFVLAFLVPNLFRRLFGEGVLSAAFVPTYTQQREGKDPAQAARTLRATSTALVLLLGALTLVGCVAVALIPAEWIAIALNTTLESARLLQVLVPVLFPFVVLVCLTALWGAALNVHGRFMIPSAAPIVLNVVWIIAVVAVAPWIAPGDAVGQVVIVSIGILVGGFAMLVLEGRALRRLDVPLRPLLDLRDKGLRTVASRMAPTILGAGIAQVNTLLDSVFAELFVHGDGAVSALYYSNRMFQFPLALVGVAMATAVFPLLSRQAARGQHDDLFGALIDAMRRTFYVAVPATVGLWIVREPLIAALFQHGQFGYDEAVRTADALGYFAIGLWAACWLQVIVRGFYALGDMKTPMRWGIVTVVANGALNVVLVQTSLREAGIALATSITTTLSACVLLFLLTRRLRKLGDLPRDTDDTTTTPLATPTKPRPRITTSTLRTIIGATAMGAGCFGVDRLVIAWWPAMEVSATGDSNTPALVARIAIVVAAGVVIYPLVTWMLRSREVAEVATPIIRRFRRRAR